MVNDRRSFHSNDFVLDGINGKTQEEWESEWSVVGEIQHLKGLGWERYQWRHTDREECRPDVRLGGSMKLSRSCFAEFFSTAYHGYLRGDGATVAEAVNKCLNRAQAFSRCEKSPGHKYESLPGYTNGLIHCVHCGFNGHSNITEILSSRIENLESVLIIERQLCAERVRHIEETGRTYEESLAEGMKQVMGSIGGRKDEGEATHRT